MITPALLIVVAAAGPRCERLQEDAWLCDGKTRVVSCTGAVRCAIVGALLDAENEPNGRDNTPLAPGGSGFLTSRKDAFSLHRGEHGVLVSSPPLRADVEDRGEHLLCFAPAIARARCESAIRRVRALPPETKPLSDGPRTIKRKSLWGDPIAGCDVVDKEKTRRVDCGRYVLVEKKHADLVEAMQAASAAARDGARGALGLRKCRYKLVRTDCSVAERASGGTIAGFAMVKGAPTSFHCEWKGRSLYPCGSIHIIGDTAVPPTQPDPEAEAPASEALPEARVIE